MWTHALIVLDIPLDEAVRVGSRTALYLGDRAAVPVADDGGTRAARGVAHLVFAWSVRPRRLLGEPHLAGVFERNVIPAAGSRGVVLNWSQRKQWSFSVPVALFRFFGERGSSIHWLSCSAARLAASIALLPPLPSVQARTPAGSRGHAAGFSETAGQLGSTAEGRVMVLRAL